MKLVFGKPLVFHVVIVVVEVVVAVLVTMGRCCNSNSGGGKLWCGDGDGDGVVVGWAVVATMMIKIKSIGGIELLQKIFKNF